MGRCVALLAAAALLPSTAFGLQLKLSDTLTSIPGAPPATVKQPYPGASQALVVALSVNAAAKGDRIVRMTDDGEFLARRDDLDEIAPFLRDALAYSIEGQEFIALKEIPRVKVAFDEKNLALALTLPPEGLPPQHFDLTATPKAADFAARPRSALVNYRLGYAGTDDLSKGTLSLTAETAIAFEGWLLRNQSFHSRSSDVTTNIRLETQAIRDDRANLRRFTIGDNVTPGLALGSGVPFAGLSLSKAWQLEPYLNRHPGAGYRGIAEFPSQVDFYVGNTLVMRQQVAPGPFDIQNFSYYGGRRDVRVVVRDVFGRQQTVAYPFYFSDQGLAAGFHDYSYQAGWLRGQIGIASNDYGPFVFSVFHHYGFSDAWTLGFRTEGTSSLWNGGPDVFYRNESLGLFGLHAAGSHDRDSGRNGHALSLSHAFQRGEFSSQLGWQRFSPDYVIVANGLAPRLPKQDFNASVGYATPAFGSLNLAFTRLQLADEEPARSVSLSYSKPVFAGINFTAVLRRQLTAPSGNEIFLGLQYVPNTDQNLNLNAQRDLQGVKTASMSWSNQAPHGEGLAYSLNAQRQQSAEGIDRVLAPRLEWFARHGTLSGEVTRLQGANSRSTGYSLALSGALVATGGHFIATRPVADAFAIVELVPPLAGVRVYENSQEVGRSDAQGRVLLPNISSYATNYASIAANDVPIEYTIDSVGRTFSPSLRSGMVVPFRVDRLRSFTGRFVTRVTGVARALEYHQVLLRAGGRTIEIPTAKNGEFYVENLPAGRHAAEVEINGIPCKFELDIPASDASFLQLGDVMTCDAVR